MAGCGRPCSCGGSVETDTRWPKNRRQQRIHLHSGVGPLPIRPRHRVQVWDRRQPQPFESVCCIGSRAGTLGAMGRNGHEREAGGNGQGREVPRHLRVLRASGESTMLDHLILQSFDNRSNDRDNAQGKRARRHRRARSSQKSIAGALAGSAFFGLSATSASVVMSSEATEAASCKAVRTTLAGSITPAWTMSWYSPVAALKPHV